ncbi:RecA-superfamily ATPase implicated in signal transduction [Halanaeroarchaeum sp. HSR-CO]|uniref:ATPase domain-containing protein n=1 Tax=Halanaeroarchaeum sp. HSR-CO TaxID=2866382 RepID=UPI00217CD958|nr:ATPase domain-containing protein [Halanaeroarchaeum sp. HSR-CO]UWG48992.1 RecA-superfamily ATPase implicated in signal transduction [Halanaeroarchaeum sp. HSR-CO]
MTPDRVSTGIPGVDTILNGGLIDGRNALLRGPPGSGKTIFSLYFLSAGVDAGETSLFVNLGEPSDYVNRTASAFDLHADDVHFVDLSPTDEQFSPDEAYTLFEGAAVEQPDYITALRETIEDIDPDRILLDPITEFRFLTTDERQFRKQILGFLDFLSARDMTVVLTSQATSSIPDDDLQFLTDTVINLELHSDYRTVRVSKFRGSSYRSGSHAYEIDDSGVTVFPKIRGDLEPVDHVELTKLSSGVPELDQLLNGGLSRGTVTALSGPTGAGKTTTGVQFLKEAVAQGERAVLYEFEESTRTLLDRARAINIPIEPMVERGDLSVVEVPPDAYTVDEFGHMVRTAVEEAGVDVVMIDGTKGFGQNLRGMDDDPARDLLRIGRYLRSQGVTVIVPHEVHSVTGEFKVTERGTSNLADTILFIRHVEYHGEIRKVIGALKMRTSSFERALRELEITEYGLQVGDPLPHLRGILTGTPGWNDREQTLDANNGA